MTERRKGVFGAPMRRTIGPYDAPWRDNIAQSISQAVGRVGGNERTVYRGVQKALSLADWLPGVGDAATAADAVGSFRRGNVGTGMTQAALAAVGLVPVVGDAAAAGGKALIKKAASLPDVAFTKGYQQINLGDTIVDLATRANGAVDISKVFTPVEARGRGSARVAMNHLAQQADAQGVRLELTADPLDKATSKAGLEQFYKSVGFVPNKGRNKDYSTRAGMIREAR